MRHTKFAWAEGVQVVKRVHGAGIGVVLSLLMVSCGGGKTTTTTGTEAGFQFTAPSSSPAIDAGGIVTFTTNQAAMWSLQAAFGQPPGSLSNTTTAATTVTYTAPSSVSGVTQVTVVATSAANSSQTAALAVFVNPKPSLLTPASFLTDNADCQLTFSNGSFNNDGTVGSSYQPGPNVGTLLALDGTGTYTWSIVSGSLPVGLNLGTLPGGTQCNAASCAYLYGTPTSSGCSQFQVQATDGTGQSVTSPTYYLVITPPALKVQVPDYTDWIAGVPYQPTAFTVSNGIPPYQWSASELPPNVVLNTVANNTAVAFLSGTPTPVTTIQPSLLVTDSQTPYPAVAGVGLKQAIAEAQAPCTPAAVGVNSNANMLGSYAFLLRGFDANGPVVFAGSFAADGAGNVQTGAEDIMRTTSSGSQTNVPVTGSYSVFEEQSSVDTFREIGCVTLTSSTGTTNTFAISLGGCTTSPDPGGGECLDDAQGVPGVFTTGRMIEFDNSGTRVSGIVRLQDSSAFSTGLNGSYAFGLSGWDTGGHPSTRYAAAGSVSANSGALSSAAADINDGGVLQSALTGGAGTYTIDATTGAQNGRGSATLTVGTASLNLAFYVVSANEVMLADTGTPSAANPVVSGEAIASSGQFSARSLQNSHMFHTAGFAATGPDVSIGILSFDGIGNLSGTQYEDQAGTLGTTSLSGTYTVNSTNGRVSFFASSTNSQSLGDHPLVAYAVPVPSTLTREDCLQLASCVTGFLVSTDQTAEAGLLEFQTPSAPPPPPFSSLYVAGYYFYSTDESLDAATPLINGASTANPTAATYGGVQSENYSSTSFYCQQEPGCVLLHPNEPLSISDTYSVSANGIATLGGETVAVTNGNIIFYIEESAINTHPSVTVVEQ
jgi:hypothetical protein